MLYPKIRDEYCEILFKKELWSQLPLLLSQLAPSQIFVLTDTNTQRDCLAIFEEKLPETISFQNICIPEGELHKTLDTCTKVWQALSKAGADRKALLINLGGGVVCDLGGFVAATYMRGISWINLPTSLLSMVDASVGGKTGVDFNGLKNLIGVIRNPVFVGIDPVFLKSLSYREIRSGYAEMLKHALLTEEAYWESLVALDLKNTDSLIGCIHKSIGIKQGIVSKDRNETGLRKQLNLGHTLGHAVESYYLHTEARVLHGEAIAAGILMELYLSKKHLNFPENTFFGIQKVILECFGKISIQESHLQGIIKYLAFDKKNENGKINFVLLREFGKLEVDYQVSDLDIMEAIQYYKKV